MISYTFRQRVFNHMISRSPGSVTVYRERDTASGTETIVTFTGRLCEVGSGWGRDFSIPGTMRGEAGVGRSHWCIFAPVDAAEVAAGDEVKHESPTGITRHFTVTDAKRRDEGWHIMVDERQ